MKIQDKIEEILRYKKADYSNLPVEATEKMVSKLRAKLEASEEASIEKKYRKAAAWGAEKKDLVAELIQLKKDKYSEIIDSPEFNESMTKYKEMLDDYSRPILADAYLKAFKA